MHPFPFFWLTHIYLTSIYADDIKKQFNICLKYKIIDKCDIVLYNSCHVS